jgi:hypothetical protein
MLIYVRKACAEINTILKEARIAAIKANSYKVKQANA